MCQNLQITLKWNKIGKIAKEQKKITNLCDNVTKTVNITEKLSKILRINV